MSTKKSEHKKPKHKNRAPRTRTGGFVAKRAEKIRNLTRKQRREQFLVALILLVIFTSFAGYTIYKDYRERPGIIESQSLEATYSGTDHIDLEWDAVRNTDTYVLYYKQKGRQYTDWIKLEMAPHEVVNAESNSKKEEKKAAVTVDGLEEGTEYVFVVRADNEEREGIRTNGKTFRTRKSQTIACRDHMTKLTCSKNFEIEASAETPLNFESSDEDVISVNKMSGEATVKGAGTATITITALANRKYIEDQKELEIEVIKSSPVKAGGASAFVIYNLNADNCEAVKAIYGEGSVLIPQGLGYSGDKYYVAYGMDSGQRIISFDVDGDGRSVSNPSVALGHPNGFTYAESTGLCYCVKGWSGRCVTYSPESGKYDVITLPNGASGIAYDRIKKQLYTSSRTAMIAYSCDGKHNYEVKKRVGVVKHKGNTYTQDCGGHGGIMMRCLSGSSKHGINYIDLYDMVHGNYLGSIACQLSEVESCVADEDGYLLILANNPSTTDYIWKTNINIEDIAAGL